jgi:hypothetical protein
MLFGGAPSPDGGFVIWNLLFVIYLLFGFCDLEFYKCIRLKSLFSQNEGEAQS